MKSVRRKNWKFKNFRIQIERSVCKNLRKLPKFYIFHIKLKEWAVKRTLGIFENWFGPNGHDKLKPVLRDSWWIFLNFNFFQVKITHKISSKWFLFHFKIANLCDFDQNFFLEFFAISNHFFLRILALNWHFWMKKLSWFQNWNFCDFDWNFFLEFFVIFRAIVFLWNLVRNWHFWMKKVHFEFKAML